MLSPLYRVIIFVSDVQKCAAFYKRFFGLAPLETAEPTEWQEMDAGGVRLAFHRAYGPSGPIKKATGDSMHPHKIVFYAEDVEAKRTELVIGRIPMGKIMRSGDLVMCDGSDPEGHRFQISNRK